MVPCRRVDGCRHIYGSKDSRIEYDRFWISLEIWYFFHIGLSLKVEVFVGPQHGDFGWESGRISTIFVANLEEHSTNGYEKLPKVVI